MLVVVHHRDIERALQALLYVETLWSLDILKVYSAECRRYLLHCLAEFLGVFLRYLYIEDIYASINLEQEALALHDRLAGHGAYISKSKHRCAV